MANGDFVSKHTGEEIERILDGSVVFNEYQKLSEVQKAQARRNIGAGTVDSGLVIKGYYNTYEELIAAQTNPHVSDAYGVGVQAPYNIFVWDSLNRDWVDNGTITKGEQGERGEDGKDGESPTAENITAALGYTPAANDLSNVADGAVSAAKIASGAVSRSKLAQDALYSPIAVTALNLTTRAITKDDIGKTLLFSWTPDEINIDTEFTLSLTDSLTMPLGAEIALYFMHGKSCTIKFTDGIFVDMVGEGRAVDRTLRIRERYEMVALKKMFTSGGEYWLVTGNVEVV